jgi:hypothetical protein
VYNKREMIVLIEAGLSEPPSSVSCFRDLTLYATIFLGADVLVECRQQNKDIYWRWLKSEFAMDFVKDILSYEEEAGIKIRSQRIGRGNIMAEKIDEFSLNDIMMRLHLFK